MAELELRFVQSNEPCCQRGIERIRRDAEPACRTEHGRELPRFLCCGDQEKRARLQGRVAHAREEGLLDPSADGHRLVQRFEPCELSFAQCRRKLEERQRVAAGSFDEPVTGLRRDAHVVVDQRSRRSRVQSVDTQLGQGRSLEPAVLALASGEHHHDRFGPQPPCYEDECLRGGVVEPLRVVDQAQQRTLSRCVREQAQDCQRDEKSLLASASRQAERSAERVGLRIREPAHVSHRREQELVRRGERELRLRRDADTAQNEHVTSLLACVLEQRRLADSRVAANDESAAARSAGAVQELADPDLLRIAAEQHGRIVTPRSRVRPRIEGPDRVDA